ncbi:MAG: M14 family zinc carboxypeptidase [candidate division WOR-3 bacterium]|nr:M14 family zinc carboxypeptidase [candidate division WOR-3 bacterium]
MKKLLLLFFCLSGLTLLYGRQIPKESVIRIWINRHQEVYNLQEKFPWLAIIDAQESYVDAYATSEQKKQIINAGYKITVLIDDYQQELEKTLQGYHTYAQVCSSMYAIRNQYANITKLETLGLSVQNRVILAMKVTDNPLAEEPEPEIRLVGAHHGNEKISTEVTLSFLKYLVENYGINQLVTDLINNREIWIIPILNADGHISNNRYNAAGVDLNRDYGYMWQTGSSSPWSQPETRAMQRHSQNNNITLEYEYHSTASYVNYLWDYHPKDPPDSNYIIAISQEYADSTYGSSTTRLTKINGFDWYVARGSAQDAVFGIWGGIGTTIETQQPSQQARIDSICVANRRALLAMITRAGWGISGIVRDSITQQPLFAMIKFTNPRRWPIYTDKTIGDFHKMVSAGTYTFTVFANGYQPKTYTVNVPSTGTVFLDINLLPDTDNLYYVQKIVWVRRDNTSSYLDATWTMDGLGKPDSIYYSIGSISNSTIVLEADPPIRNLPRADFTIFEGDTSRENYQVYVTNDWLGAWFSCGNGNGTTSFDLAAAGLDSARYIKIVDASGASTNNPYAGFDLDGIAYNRPLTLIEENSPSYITSQNSYYQILPNPAKSYVKFVHLNPNKNQKIKIYNTHGTLIKELNLFDQIIWNTQDHTGSYVPCGVYFCILDNGKEKMQQKIVIHR